MDEQIIWSHEIALYDVCIYNCGQHIILTCPWMREEYWCSFSVLAPTSLQYSSGPSVSTPQVADAEIFRPSAKLKYGGVNSAFAYPAKATITERLKTALAVLNIIYGWVDSFPHPNAENLNAKLLIITLHYLPHNTHALNLIVCIQKGALYPFGLFCFLTKFQ